MTGSTAPRRGQSVAQLLNTAAQVFRATLLKCLPFSMIAVLCLYIPVLYWRATGHDTQLGLMEHGLPIDPSYWWMASIGVAFALYILSAMMLRQLYFSGGFAVNARQELILAARRLPSVLVTWMLAEVTLFAGSLLILPGVFLLVCYLVMLPVVLLEGQLNPILALRRCVLLVWPNWWQVCAAFVITLLAMFVFLVVFFALVGILAQALAGAALEAVLVSATIAFYGTLAVFFSALALAIHSSANNSA